MAKEACIFCRIAKKEIPAKIVFEDNKILAFEDLRPQAPVHCLIIPKEHIAKVSDLGEEKAQIIGDLIITARDIAKEKGVEGSGYRIVINCNRDAGQDVFHLHLHLLGGRRFSWPPG